MSQAKLTLELWEGKKTKLKLPDKDSISVDVPNTKCPDCHEPLVVSGGNKRVGAFDTYHSDAVCTKCNKHVGTLKLKVDTLFGIEEDQRVFSMGIKIY